MVTPFLWPPLSFCHQTNVSGGGGKQADDDGLNSREAFKGETGGISKYVTEKGEGKCLGLSLHTVCPKILLGILVQVKHRKQLETKYEI